MLAEWEGAVTERTFDLKATGERERTAQWSAARGRFLGEAKGDYGP